MTDLPEIDFQSIARKLASNNADLLLQVLALENLAEALRKQRDEAVTEAQTLKQAREDPRNSAEDD